MDVEAGKDEREKKKEKRVKDIVKAYVFLT
jgi:hypothetical protein